MPPGIGHVMAHAHVVPSERRPSNPRVTLQFSLQDPSMEMRVNLTRPADQDNELIKVAALYGPPGMLAVMRARSDYGWFVVLCLRAIEVCVAPRNGKLPILDACDPVAFSMQMLEMEMMDEVFQLMKDYKHVRDVLKSGLAIIETLIMHDTDWRDELARKGGAKLMCDILKQRSDSPSIIVQVLACMSYLAAEDYIEIMLCQHDALEHVVKVIRDFSKNTEIALRASLTLLNLTVCEPHIEELLEKDGILPMFQLFDVHDNNPDVITAICGVLANFSVKIEAQYLLARERLFPRIRDAMLLDPSNAALQVACLKAVVNYSADPDFYRQMEEEGLAKLVGQAMVDHADDPGVQKYGNYFLGQQSSCPMM